MGSNFNINIKPVKKDEDEIDDTIDDELADEAEIRRSNNAARSKSFKLLGGIMVVGIILIAILWIVSMLMPKSYEYEDIEAILKKAAIAYFKDYPDQLPQSEGAGVEIDHTNLVAAEKMKDLSKYLKEGVSCSAVVQVQKSGDDYLYTPYLNCGEEYTTMELYKAIINQGTVSQGQYGLYSMNGEYVYRGENVNNYVQLDEGLWRVVKVSNKNNVVLVKDEEAGNGFPYDDRYNQDLEWKAGINSFSASRIKDDIEKMYQNPNKDLNEVFLSKNDKKRLVLFNLCTGKRSKSDTSNDNSLECKTTEANTKVGLLTASDYMRASVDTNCTSTVSKSCYNYNYLKTKDDYWLVTGDSQSTSEVFIVNESGFIESVFASTYANIRPVVYLNERTMYKSGKGTKEKPFKLK